MSDKILKELPGVQKKILLKDYTTYKIGGPAKYFFIARTKDDLITAVKAAEKLKLPVFILGGGSNLLISEKGFNGLVIKIDISGIEFYPHTKRDDVAGENINKDGSRSGVGVKANKAVVGAGAGLTKLAYLSADNGLSGLEWSAGVPGTLGGAIYGNAQAFGTKICDAIESIEAINLKTLELKSFTKKQCQFSLKNSIFKKNKNWVIVSANLIFQKKDIKEIKNKINEFLEYRKTRHPIDFPSAGSTFVNPEINPHTRSLRGNFGVGVKIKKLYKKYPELEEYVKKGVIPSGYLIAKCGMAGKKIGNAQISEKHSNFIINLGGAKAKDVLSLMASAKKKVKANFGISLETEVQLVGFNRKII